ncbi:MAG: hypothetical protein RIM84_08215 [Alphaproteobacteria bacterium]
MAIHGTLASYGMHGGRRFSLIGIAVLFVGAVVLGGAYGAGLITFLGYETRSSTETKLYATDNGFEIGLNTLWLFEGQTYYVDYEATVERGQFRFGLFKLPLNLKDDTNSFRKVLRADGAGTATWRVTATGLYLAYFDADSEIGEREHEVDFTVTWGARF